MKRGKMKFRKAKQDDKEEILALYQSLILRMGQWVSRRTGI